MIYCVFGAGIIYPYKSPIDKGFSLQSGRSLRHETFKPFADNHYRLLMIIMTVSLFSSLPLFVTYLSLGP